VTPAAVALAVAAYAEPGAPTEPASQEPRPEVVVPVVHALALMTVMRLGESVLYPDPFSRTQYFGAHYEEAFTRPPLFDGSRRAFEWDGDPWTINVLGHGLFGSELYLRARMCHLRWYGSLAFAAAASAVWEYGFEANGVRPSALDLVYTPLAGLALGEARHVAWQAAGGLQSGPLRTLVRAAVDPLGEIERGLGTGC
jgi:Domain of unknown function (DUF3943)